MSVDYFYIARSEESSIGRNVDPNSVLLGDVDGDGKVDSTDARLILQCKDDTIVRRKWNFNS